MSPSARLEIAACLIVATSMGLSLSARELAKITGLSARSIERQLICARSIGVVPSGWDKPRGGSTRWQSRR
jgi:hypothetical protein